jgi:hypothetical protein
MTNKLGCLYPTILSVRKWFMTFLSEDKNCLIFTVSWSSGRNELNRLNRDVLARQARLISLRHKPTFHFVTRRWHFWPYCRFSAWTNTRSIWCPLSYRCANDHSTWVAYILLFLSFRRAWIGAPLATHRWAFLRSPSWQARAITLFPSREFDGWDDLRHIDAKRPTEALLSHWSPSRFTCDAGHWSLWRRRLILFSQSHVTTVSILPIYSTSLYPVARRKPQL